MITEKKKKVKIWDKIAIGVLVIYGITMFLAFNYEDIFYMKYESIHNNIDPDIPGYEIPIVKNIELVNNRVSDGIAYSKYNLSPDEYEKLVEELKKDAEKEKNNKNAFKDEVDQLGLYSRLSYNISYETQLEVSEAERDAGITDMYLVDFGIIQWHKDEVKKTWTYRRQIAEIDGSWIFYDKDFSVPRDFLYEEPIE